MISRRSSLGKLRMHSWKIKKNSENRENPEILRECFECSGKFCFDKESNFHQILIPYKIHGVTKSIHPNFDLLYFSLNKIIIIIKISWKTWNLINFLVYSIQICQICIWSGPLIREQKLIQWQYVCLDISWSLCGILPCKFFRILEFWPISPGVFHRDPTDYLSRISSRSFPGIAPRVLVRFLLDLL